MIIIIREAIRGGGEETCVKRMRHAASDSTTQPDACERRVSVHVRLSSLEHPQILFPVLPERQRWEKCQARYGKAHNVLRC